MMNNDCKQLSKKNWRLCLHVNTQWSAQKNPTLTATFSATTLVEIYVC